MNFEQIEKIANVVLYEGYNLYPYRPSARKNQRRWTFGRVYPEAYSCAQNGTELCTMQVQLLVTAPAGKTGPAPALTVKLRFLQIVDRQIGQLTNPLAAWPATGEPEFQRVAALRIGENIYHTWQEGVEQSVDISAVSLADIVEGFLYKSFSFAASRTVEPIYKAPQEIVGVIVRQKQEQRGMMALTAEPVDDGLYQVTVQIKNVSPLEYAGLQTEQTILPATFASTHAILGVENGQFLSLTAPPPVYREAATACENIGLWPVLAGEAETPAMMLASPIILYDYPKVAPESAGDFFDGTEIDEMLALRVLTLTDEEKREMAQVDQFARKILERTEAAPEAYLMNLHGTWREPGRPSPAEVSPWDFLGENTRLEAIAVKGVIFKEGDRVRLKPRGGADAFDLIVAGQIAVIEAIEQDFENNIHFAVVLEQDPGKDLGFMRQPGHRFFYSPDEVALLDQENQDEY